MPASSVRRTPQRWFSPGSPPTSHQAGSAPSMLARAFRGRTDPAASQRQSAGADGLQAPDRAVKRSTEPARRRLRRCWASARRCWAFDNSRCGGKTPLRGSGVWSAWRSTSSAHVNSPWLARESHALVRLEPISNRPTRPFGGLWGPVSRRAVPRSPGGRSGTVADGGSAAQQTPSGPHQPF